MPAIAYRIGADVRRGADAREGDGPSLAPTARSAACTCPRCALIDAPLRALLNVHVARVYGSPY